MSVRRLMLMGLAVAGAVLLGLGGVAGATVRAQPVAGRIVFADFRGGPRRGDVWAIRSIRLDGRDRRDVSRPSKRWGARPLPSPDGKRIMFLEGGTSVPGWYVAGSEGSSVRVVGVDGRGMRVPASGYDPAWSPDGRRIAFAVHLGEPLSIYVVGAAGGDWKRVVAAGESPSWSPDGRRIAYVDPDSGAVFVINVDGTGRQRIAPGLVWDNSVEGDYTAAGYAPVWSPGGRRVAFAADRPGSRLPSIAVAPIDGAPAKQIALGDDPRWSPDGELIAFDSLGTRGGVAVVRPGGGGLRTLSPSSDAAWPAWSPDGSQLSFVRLWPTQQVFVIGRGGKGLRQVTREPSDATFAAGPEWLDAQTLVYASGPSPWLGLFTIRPDGSGVHRLRYDAVDDHQPSWSPDGRKIFFTHGLYGTVIDVMNADGSHLRQLTGGQLNAFHPSWSPDGRSIAFFSWDATAGNARLYVMHPDGTGLRKLADAGDVLAGVDWSPDSTQIVYGTEDAACGCASLAIVAVTGGTPVDLPSSHNDPCRSADEEFAPAWSPDGHTIAFISDSYEELCDNGNMFYWLQTISPDGTNPRVPAIPDHGLVDTYGDFGDFLTIGTPFPFSDYDFTPRVAWSPDSSWLIFSAARGIQIVHPDGTGWRHLTSGTDPDWTR